MTSASTPNDERIVLDLHGSRADKGIEVDALETFFDNLRRALRDFDRDRRGEMVGRGGHPDSRDAAVGAFRLVKFRIGSSILTLEPTRKPPPKAASGDALELADQHRATATFSALLDAVEAREHLTPTVIDALGSATRALGDQGRFGVKLPGRKNKVRITPDLLESLRHVDANETHDVTITGKMHLLEVAEPMQRVGIKAPDGVDWTCSYPPPLKPAVMSGMDKLVHVRGRGRKVTPMTGRMDLHSIEVLPEFPQDELFTAEPVAEDELRARQGITEPQGIAAVIDSDWEDDDASKRFLEATLGEIR